MVADGRFFFFFGDVFNVGTIFHFSSELLTRKQNLKPSSIKVTPVDDVDR